MHSALGYSWFPTAAGYHWERALLERGHRLTFVGLGHAQRPGYDSTPHQCRLLDEHTYAHRVDRLLEIVTASGFQQMAPLRKASTADCRAARHTVFTHLHMLDALLDDARAAGFGPFRRFWTILPCLARRLLI